MSRPGPGRPRPRLLYWPRAEMTSVHLDKDPGGIARGLAELGDPAVLLTGRADGLEIPGVQILATHSPSVWAELRAARRCLREQDPGTVIVLRREHSYLATVLADRLRQLGRRGRRRWVLKMDSDGSASSRAERWGNRAIVALASLLFDRVVVESPCAYRRFRPYALRRRTLKVVPDGYPAFHYALRSHAAGPRAPIVLCVARVTPTKGQRELVEAFAALAPEFPAWKLHLVGPIDDPGFRADLESQVHRLGLQDRVVLVGPVSAEALAEAYAQASIFALLSRRESFGLVRTEAIANGLPVLTSGAGCAAGMRELAMFVAEDPVETTAPGLLRSLMADPARRAEAVAIGQRGLLTWSEVTGRIVDGADGPTRAGSGSNRRRDSGS